MYSDYLVKDVEPSGFIVGRIYKMSDFLTDGAPAEAVAKMDTPTDYSFEIILFDHDGVPIAHYQDWVMNPNRYAPEDAYHEMEIAMSAIDNIDDARTLFGFV